jgi:hypothetical protein
MRIRSRARSNRFQWIDNSTTPPTIWYPDFLTQMFVRIQPLE